MRTALAGSDAGANLALALAQLPSVRSGVDPFPNYNPPRSNPPPAAVVSITGILDFTTPTSQKVHSRRTKPPLRSNPFLPHPLSSPRSSSSSSSPLPDWISRLLPSAAWSYIPYGHDIADPLLSPAFAARADLPPHVFVIGAEMDCLAHESWRAVCRWAAEGSGNRGGMNTGGKDRRRLVPGMGDKPGREGWAMWRGCLDDGAMGDGERFGWCEEYFEAGGKGGGVRGSTRWLLVPDVGHGFDRAGWRGRDFSFWGDEVARMDAEMKTVAYQREMGEWLWGVVWRSGRD